MHTSYAEAWSKTITDIVEGALASGRLVDHELRTIVLAPMRDGLSLGVWLGSEWSDYPYIDDDEDIVGAISLAPWLAEVDGLARGEDIARGEPPFRWPRPSRFIDPVLDNAWDRAFQGLITDARLAARLAATGALARLGDEGRIVGVFFTMDNEAEARLVGICHPAGGELLPIMIKRDEDGALIYPQAGLTDDGIVLFFCEGEADAVKTFGSRHKLQGCVRPWRFDDMVSIRKHGAWGTGCSVLFRGDVHEFGIEAGYTHEKHGDPAKEEVVARIHAHLARRPSLWFDPANVEAPATVTELVALLNSVGADARRDVINGLATRHTEKLASLLDGSTSDLDAVLRAQLVDALARPLAMSGAFERALQLLDSAYTDGNDHGPTRKDELARTYCLVQLGRNQEATEAKDERSAALRAIALARLGMAVQATQLLEEDGRDTLVARGIIAAEAGKLSEGVAFYREALAADNVTPLLASVAARIPALRAVQAEKDDWSARFEASAAQSAAVPVTELDLGAIRRARREPSRGLFTGTATKNTDAELASAVATERGWFAGTDTGALLSLGRSAADREVPPVVPSLAAKERLTELHARPLGLIASDEHTVWWIRDGKIAHTAPPRYGRHGFCRVSPSGHFAVQHASGTLEVLRDGERVGAWSSADARYLQDATFVSETTVWCSVSGELYVVDIENPVAPITRGRYKLACQTLEALGDLVALYSGDDLVVASCRDPLRPSPLGRAPCERAPRLFRDHDRLWYFADRGCLRCLEVDASHKRLGVLTRYVARATSEFDAPLAFTVHGERLHLVDRSRGLVTLERRVVDDQALRAKLSPQARIIEALLREQLLVASQRGSIVGTVRLSVHDGFARLELAGPATSILNVASYLGEALEAQVSLSDADSDEDNPPEALEREATGFVRAQIAAEALHAILPLLSGPGFARSPLVCLISPRGREIVALVDNPTGTPRPTPARKNTGGGALDRLRSKRWYMEREALVERAKTDEAFRAATFDWLTTSAEEGEVPEAALVVAASLLDEPPLRAQALEPILAAAATDPAACAFALARAKDDPRARELLAQLVDDDDFEAAMTARRALGRMQEPAAITRVKERLREALEEDGEVPRFLERLEDTDLSVFKDELLALWNQNSHDSDLLLLCVRADADVPATAFDPESERSAEGDSLFAGIGGGEEDTSLSALRLWSARRIRARLRTETPHVVEEIEAEPFERGRQRLLERLWSCLEEGERDALVERLSRAGLDEHHGKLALSLLHFVMVRGETRATGLADALTRSLSDAKALELARTLARQHRVQRGWQVMKAGELGQARLIADAALDDEPDGQVYFFDARLAWLEAGDPRAALPKIEIALTRSVDKEGLARLYNLRGAVFDELKQYDESITCFERALAANPADAAMLYSNIAEAHEKCGRLIEAKAFAQRAAARGSTTDVVKRLNAI